MNIGVFGCGRMGAAHIEAIQSCKNANIIAIGDINLNCCENLRSRFHGALKSALSYESLTMLISENHLDLLVLSTTSDCRSALVVEAIKKGVPAILCEKPLATSLGASKMIQESAEAASTHIAVNHQMRYLPQYIIPKDLLCSEPYEGLKSMHVAGGNFGMAMNAIHYFEAFRFLTNEAPCEICAWFDEEILPNPRGPQFQDVSGCIRVSTASGRRLYIDASADQGHGVQVTYMARNGRITVDELSGAMTTVVRSPEHREAPTSRYGMPVEIEQHKIPPVELVDSTRAVLQALLTGEGYPTLSDATLAVKALVAAYHSHRQGGVPVRLADIADNDPEVFPWA